MTMKPDGWNDPNQDAQPGDLHDQILLFQRTDGLRPDPDAYAPQPPVTPAPYPYRERYTPIPKCRPCMLRGTHHPATETH